MLKILNDWYIKNTNNIELLDQLANHTDLSWIFLFLSYF